MFEYQEMLDMAMGLKPLKRTVIQGGRTGGSSRIKPDLQEVVKKVELPKGIDYATKYQEQDENEEYEEYPGATSERGKLSQIEVNSVSVGQPNLLDFIDDHLLEVYDNYEFDKKKSIKLLVHDYKEEIINQVDVSTVVIIKGGTGCGKTTQVPQFILDSCKMNNMYCNIVVTQPRRIATLSVARRVAEERSWSVGSLVGYQIGLEKNISKDTRLLYCTTGVLLHQLVHKQNLSNYTHIIVDEVHERDQETDFLLILIKKFLKVPGCRTKIILMSATINTEKFVNYFSRKVGNVIIDPPVIELDQLVNFPVHYYYLDDLINRVLDKVPVVEIDRPGIDNAGYDLAVTLIEAFRTIDEIEHKNSRLIGSVLVFLPGLHEIEKMHEKLEKRLSDTKYKVGEKWYLCPLHSSVTFEEQLKVFKPAPAEHRKIILATNIAESSITVPDVKYVIDFCLMKQQVQELETNFTSLQMIWISKSQGTQRAGRVGRVMSGRVYRFVPKAMYESFDEDTSPEILRSPLDQLVLKAKLLGSGPPASILGRALDPPDLSNIHRTILNLKEMGALLSTSRGTYIEDDGDLTFIGNVMARLPLDTKLSKLIILGHMFNILRDCIIMASAMSLKSMFSSPFKQQLEAYNSKLTWADSSCSDPIAFLNAYKLWRHYHTTGRFKRSGGLNESEWTRRYFIQLQVMREVSKLESEILNRLREQGITETTKHGPFWNDQETPLILKVVIAGAFYPNHFIRRQIDEKEAVRTLDGHDPFSSIYLTNLPMNQPGKLYTSFIKKHFAHCGSQIKVFFDGSSKVYLKFGSSNVQNDRNADDAVLMPGKIKMAVYRAIKLRHLQIPITIPLMKPAKATERAIKLFGEDPLRAYCFSNRKEKLQKQSVLPNIHTTFMEVTITHIEDPHRFWVQMHYKGIDEKINWIHEKIFEAEQNEEIPKLSSFKVGDSVLSPYSENGFKSYYRATITALGSKDNVQVYYIDYGNSLWLNSKELRGWTESLKEVKEEPCLAMPAMLSELQPSVLQNPKGNWSQTASNTFRLSFQNKKAIASIYSIVDDVTALTLFNPEELHSLENLSEIPFEKSFNNVLITQGFADKAEEPYLSRENHLVRETALNIPDSTVYLKPHLISEENEDFESPSIVECESSVNLKGPMSPLEMSLYGLTQKSQGLEIQIDWSSVNSVLLDTYPMDRHERLLVAGLVTQSPSGSRITLRNTTMMPNIHGLYALMAMIFAPFIELRANPARTQLTGILCGSGYYKETGQSYFPENDVEIPFDTTFDLKDIEDINKLRYWMNYVVSGGSDWESESSLPRIVEGQKKIKNWILKLLSRRRSSCGVTLEERAFVWNKIEEERKLNPRGNEEEEPSIYPLIWGIYMDEPSPGDPIIEKNLARLHSFSIGEENMKDGILCKLCQVYMENVPQVQHHLSSKLHRDIYAKYCSQRN